MISYDVRHGDVTPQVRGHHPIFGPVELVTVGASEGAGGDYLERKEVSVNDLGISIYWIEIRTSSAWSTGHHLSRWSGQLHRSLLGCLMICQCGEIN